jgi:hypothetical protein
MESNYRKRIPRRRCISEIGVQASDFFAAAAAEQLSPAAAAEQLSPAAALLEELEVTKRKDIKSAHKKRMAKEMGKEVPAQAVATASKNSQEDRLRQLRLELLQGTAKRERRQLASSLKQLRITGRISNNFKHLTIVT